MKNLILVRKCECDMFHNDHVTFNDVHSSHVSVCCHWMLRSTFGVVREQHSTVAKLLLSSSAPSRAIAELVSPVISGAVPYEPTSALDVGTCGGVMT